MRSFKLIVNATPLGMYPEMERYPELPYDFIGKEHLCYDLIYNPDATLFLKKCEAGGATIMNGLSMLHLQAEKAWEIWKG
jgi:shikimate dehydrogenase